MAKRRRTLVKHMQRLAAMQAPVHRQHVKAATAAQKPGVRLPVASGGSGGGDDESVDVDGTL
jgi:hypothetical protein